MNRIQSHEKNYLTDQIRRLSRSVYSNLVEAWRVRRYEVAFVSKLNDSESEAAKTQTWLSFTHSCGYLHQDRARELRRNYDHIIGKLVNMIIGPTPWLLTADSQGLEPKY